MATQSVQKFSHTDKEISSLIESLKTLNVDTSYYLVLMTGKYNKGKKQFLKKAASAVGTDILTIDLDTVITTDEEESYQNIDKLFEQLAGESKYIHFASGDRLSGAYTGYSYSVQKYSTPQERYFLKKINTSEKVVFIDFKDRYNANSTMRRMAQTMVLFDQPNSFLSKLFWKLSQVKVHGSEFESSRNAAL